MRAHSLLLALAAAAVAIPACRREPPPALAQDLRPQALAGDEPLHPIPQQVALDHRRVILGERLFHDPRLSRDDDVSCATCHPLDRGGTDGKVHSRGSGGVEAAINTPTVFNVGFNSRFNWNGAYDSLEAELDAPLTRAMGTTADAIAAKLHRIEDYPLAFRAAYADGLTAANLRDALATFQLSLITPNARFDRWLRGDQDALSGDERQGYELFKTYGCASCHQGRNVGGNMFQRFGVMDDYFGQRGDVRPADLGRFNVTSKPSDRHVFRVPSLRNVARTAPYFHDGSAATLEEAIETMSRYQLGRPMQPDDLARIAAFLRTLTGEHAGQPL